MKRVLVAALAYSAVVVWSMTIKEIKDAMPELAHMNDKQVLDYLHERYYSNMDKSLLASRIGVKLSSSASLPISPS
jgi:hypothetical protein